MRDMNRTQARKRRRKKRIVKKLARALIVTLVTAIWIVAVLSISILVITKGPSEEGKNIFVTTMLETGQFKWVVNLFMSEEEINDVVAKNSMGDLEEDSDASLIDVNSGDLDLSAITIEDVEGDNWSGKMMIVNDPSRVFVGTTYPWTEYGSTLDTVVNKYGATGGVNGGMYLSDLNKGGQPIGPVVSNGEIQNMDNDYIGLVMIGMSNENILKIIDINGMSTNEITTLIQKEGIRDAVCFQEEHSDANNHFVKLIINGEARELNGLGSGANPRTAIGQTADGRILLLTTDGRGANGHLGATASDLIEVMQKYGAVNAANLDGGSSSSMYYQGGWLQTSVTLYYSNSSWNIPDAVLVR